MTRSLQLINTNGASMIAPTAFFHQIAFYCKIRSEIHLYTPQYLDAGLVISQYNPMSRVDWTASVHHRHDLIASFPRFTDVQVLLPPCPFQAFLDQVLMHKRVNGHSCTS